MGEGTTFTENWLIKNMKQPDTKLDHWCIQPIIFYFGIILPVSQAPAIWDPLNGVTKHLTRDLLNALLLSWVQHVSCLLLGQTIDPTNSILPTVTGSSFPESHTEQRFSQLEMPGVAAGTICLQSLCSTIEPHPLSIICYHSWKGLSHCTSDGGRCTVGPLKKILNNR